MRQIILDTETTGINPEEGHNIIEIGCVVLERRRITDEHFHEYIKPDRDVEEEAISVHGITNEFLQDKPAFAEVADAFIEFVRGAELIIHNAAFDIGFLDAELARNGYSERMADICPRITDTLLMARRKFPGQKNNLDALCRRYSIEHFDREYHGALLDSRILGEVYLHLTGGQTSLQLGEGQDEDGGGGSERRPVAPGLDIPVLRASEAELAAHDAFLELLEKKSGGACLWKQLESRG